MKEFEIGMVLGKFYPPHKGHLHLINTAIEQCDIVYVLCCSLKSEKISGNLRWLWLQMIYSNNKNVKIIHVTDENPQYPEEHEQFWAIWQKTVFNHVPRELEAIFTSEDYGDPFAKVLGCKHVLVDKARGVVPVSGTAIRENPFANWDYIPDEVKGYFTKKIVLVGPESTGKTTLVENLSNFFNGNMVEEYGRTYTNDMSDLYQLTKQDLERIALGQVININKISQSNKKLCFIDTEAITTKVFGQLYLGDNFHSSDIDMMIKTQKFDLWLFMDIDVPYINDGNRLPETIRGKHSEMIREQLNKNKISYITLNGDYENRYEMAKNEVFKLLS